MTGRRLRRLALAAVALLILGVAGPWTWLHLATAGDRHRGVEGVPHRPVALVLGAGIRGAAPTPFLAHRLDLAAALFAAGRVEHLLLSGDHGRTEHDEVTVMRNYLLARGVPEGVITLDHAGFDTYDSCVRARRVFGVRAAVVVSQDFHLARAVYTCRRAGIDAVGAGVSEWAAHRSTMVRVQVRELAADLKALWEVHVTRPDPRFLGPVETLR